MPELPEVETVRLGLAAHVIGRKIVDVWIGWPNLLANGNPFDFREKMLGQRLRAIDRIGKFLIFYWDDITWLAHLRMEGKFLLKEGAAQEDKYTHICFRLDSGQKLLYRDVRKFGRLRYFPCWDIEKEIAKLNLGPEPKDLSISYLKTTLARRSIAIKSALLDQSVVSGLGNIYADETLFKAGIDPRRPAKTLDDKEISALIGAAQSVIEAALLAGGTTIRTYANTFGKLGTYQAQLQVYGKVGQACPKCQRVLEKIQLGGRGTTFCPYCQH